MVNKLSPTLFDRKCERDPQTGCWNWRSHVQTAGYGQVRISGGHWLTHRASWHVHNGPIPTGLDVLHRCDNRRCCNPQHLFLGTDLDNHRDAVAKGRKPNGFPMGAQRLPRVRKLTDEQVIRIRDSDQTAKQLAEEMGVLTPCIYRIRNGTRKARVIGSSAYLG